MADLEPNSMLAIHWLALVSSKATRSVFVGGSVIVLVGLAIAVTAMLRQFPMVIGKVSDM